MDTITFTVEFFESDVAEELKEEICELYPDFEDNFKVSDLDENIYIWGNDKDFSLDLYTINSLTNLYLVKDIEISDGNIITINNFEE